MAPIAAVIFSVIGIPFIRALYLSFTNKMVGVLERFIGFDDHLALLEDKIYWKPFHNMIIYTVGCITAKLVLGLLLIAILNQKFRGKAFPRVALLIPWVLPGMVAATTWRRMYDNTYGIINSPLLKAGPIGLPIPWLNDPDTTLLSTILVNVWGGIPFFVFSLLGMLWILDGQTFETTCISGAGMSKCFWCITLPGISSVLGISTLLPTIWTFNDFESTLLITGGGPTYSSSVVSTYTYDLALIRNPFGRALPVTVSIIPLIVIPILIPQKVISGDGIGWGRRWTGW